MLKRSDSTTPRWNSVYYNLLLEDAKTYHSPAYEGLHQNATAKLGKLGQNFFYMKKDSTDSFLRNMANIEARKEMMLLQTYFGGYNGSFSTAEDVKKLTAAIQTAFNFREISERNADAILSREGKKSIGSKGVFSYFGSYFEREFLGTVDGNKENTKNSEFILNQVIEAMKKNPKITAEQAVHEALKIALPSMLDNVFRRMFVEAGLEKNRKIKDDKFNKAYLDIYEAWTRNKSTDNPFVKQLLESHDFEKMYKDFAEFVETNLIKGKKSSKWKETDLNPIVKKILNSSKAKREGYSLEALEGYALYLLQQQFESNKRLQLKTSGYGVHAFLAKGKLGARPDNTITFGIDVDDVEKAFAEATTDVGEEQKRLKAVKAFSKLSDKLKKYNNKSFIVYFNDKNVDALKGKGYLDSKYGQGVGSSITGHTAGSVTFGDLESLLKQTKKIVARGGLHQLIYNVINTLPETIGEYNTEAVSSILAQLVAFILFDDYRSIGSINIKGGGNAIHIFDLEGTMIPLSAFLFAMADAFESLENFVESGNIVRVMIQGPDILYPKGDKIADERAQNAENDEDSTRGSRFGGREYWEKQTEDALEKGTIEWFFITDMVEFLKNYVVLNTK